MTKKEFRELTGEDPEDVLGGDWKNEINMEDDKEFEFKVDNGDNQ